jgi:hypothetical protein
LSALTFARSSAFSARRSAFSSETRVVKLSTFAYALVNRSPTSTSFPSFPTYSSLRHCTSSQNCHFALVFTRCVLICNSLCPPSSPLPCRTTNASSAYSTRFAPLGMPPNAFTSSSATTKKKPPSPSPLSPPRVCCGEEKKQIVVISSSSDIKRLQRSKIKEGFDIVASSSFSLFALAFSFLERFSFKEKKKERSARARANRKDDDVNDPCPGEREREREKETFAKAVVLLLFFFFSRSLSLSLCIILFGTCLGFLN